MYYIIFTNPYIDILIILCIVLGLFGFFRNIFSGIIVAISIIGCIVNIIVSLVYVCKKKPQSIIGKIRKVLLGIFVTAFPVVLCVFLLISGEYINEHRINYLNQTLTIKYQNPKVYLISTLVGIVINFIMIVISMLADYCEKNHRRFACVIVNFTIIFLFVCLPYCGKTKTYEHRIEVSKKYNREECVVCQDDELFTVIRINYKINAISNEDELALKFLKYKVKEGDILYKTGKIFYENDDEYYEVYNDSVWGYIFVGNVEEK